MDEAECIRGVYFDAREGVGGGGRGVEKEGEEGEGRWEGNGKGRWKGKERKKGEKDWTYMNSCPFPYFFGLSSPAGCGRKPPGLDGARLTRRCFGGRRVLSPSPPPFPPPLSPSGLSPTASLLRLRGGSGSNTQRPTGSQRPPPLLRAMSDGGAGGDDPLEPRLHGGSGLARGLPRSRRTSSCAPILSPCPLRRWS